MAARAIQSGTISFGLVNIPVKVYSANESGGRISFNQLHKKCKGRLKQQLYCPTDDEVVSREDIVKGYEYAKDQYVVFTEEELEALEEAASKAMEISEFVPIETVDPLYFDTGYYLGPEKGAERAFKLLAVALRESRHAAVARYVSRGRMNVVLLRPLGDQLVMQQLRYADEIRSPAEIPVGEAQVKDAELALARQFIQSLATEKFDPSKYKDEYRAKLKDIKSGTVKGEAVTIAAPAPSPPQVVDLMEALKASLAKAQKPAEVPKLQVAPPAPEERKGPKRAPRLMATEKKKASKR